MKPLLLDLGCSAGGCTRGYQLAGFEVWGCDVNPQPHYCGDLFFQMDALEFLALFGFLADAIHASPMCQHYTKAAKQWRGEGREYPDQIAEWRAAIQATGKPYVIENVPDAADQLVHPIRLNAAYFGLLVLRDRLFECSVPVPQPVLPAPAKRPVKMGRPVQEGDIVQPVGHFSGVAYARRQMGITWYMTQGETAQAIPPAYTHYIGRYLLPGARPLAKAA